MRHTRMDNYRGLHEDDTNSTYCEQCGCRITRGQCQHGAMPPRRRPKDCDLCCDPFYECYKNGDPYPNHCVWWEKAKAESK